MEKYALNYFATSAMTSYSYDLIQQTEDILCFQQTVCGVGGGVCDGVTMYFIQ